MQSYQQRIIKTHNPRNGNLLIIGPDMVTRLDGKGFFPAHILSGITAHVSILEQHPAADMLPSRPKGEHIGTTYLHTPESMQADVKSALNLSGETTVFVMTGAIPLVLPALCHHNVRRIIMCNPVDPFLGILGEDMSAARDASEDQDVRKGFNTVKALLIHNTKDRLARGVTGSGRNKPVQITFPRVVNFYVFNSLFMLAEELRPIARRLGSEPIYTSSTLEYILHGIPRDQHEYIRERLRDKSVHIARSKGSKLSLSNTVEKLADTLNIPKEGLHVLEGAHLPEPNHWHNYVKVINQILSGI